jgi:hypothetical protein
MADINNGLTLWQNIATTLNDIITATGKKIDINNPQIWDEHLHRLSNDDWRDILSALAKVLDESPQLAKPYRVNNLQKARARVLSAKSNERPLDRKRQGGKAHAWAMIHTLRETWNEIQGVDIPNEDRKTPPTPKTLVETTEEFTRVTIWHNLFEKKDNE